ncbi:MAG: sulfate adenylyltransferase subunit CysN [Alphaproteobacteria bacterium]|nr:sulfate adenylyltransferase subunit CysN [Alphaproteobacteria bacterium]
MPAYLARQEAKGLLRFLTCGSVDDGKSTLIGRLLFESRTVFEDHLAALGTASKKHGTTGDDLDLALLVDGLAAEREQGITIDVAYRFFATERRKFIVADAPGHEQYTRNMATGASTADLAVVLVDARKGVLPQTRRHSFIVAMLGVKRVVLAVNKMDLVGFDPARFDAIVADYRAVADALGIDQVQAIPLVARDGDNVVAASERMPWYRGPSLLAHLETVPLTRAAAHDGPMRLPVQWVNRPDADFRGYAGQVAGGTVRPGDRIVVLPSGRTSRVARIVTMDGDLAEAGPGRSVTVTLTDAIDVGRGDVLVGAAAVPSLTRRVRARVLWLNEAPLQPGAGYLFKTHARTVVARPSVPDHRIDIERFVEQPADTLALNEIGTLVLRFEAPVPFAPYAEEPTLGGGILIDRLTNDTVGLVIGLAAVGEPAGDGGRDAADGDSDGDLHRRLVALRAETAALLDTIDARLADLED